MGLFDLFKKKEEKINVIDTIDKSDWLQVFSYCLGKMMVIQNNASEYVVKNQNWNVDFSKGVIAFENDEYPVQFIGSESNISNTWNWGWNNINKFQDSILILANETLVNGFEFNLNALKFAQFELDDTYNGHHLAIVACALSKDDYFYYRGPHGKGAVLMAVGNLPKEVFSPINLTEFINLTMQCIHQFTIDHKIFVEALLEWNKTSYTWKKDGLIAHFNQDLSISFEKINDLYRITQINTDKL